MWFDDFGTGWSELTHLVDVPVDGIKIDRFFTERLGGRADAVVQGAARGGGGPRPGHDDRGHRHHGAGGPGAASSGCDLAQGYLWSEPLSAPEAEALLAAAGS